MTHDEMIEEIRDCAESQLTSRCFDNKPEFPKDLVLSVYAQVAAELEAKAQAWRDLFEQTAACRRTP